MYRLLSFVTLIILFGVPLCFARAIPDPEQKPAPGNEQQQAPLSKAGYSPAVNYQLQCAGCHLSKGEGAPANDIPRMAGFVGAFLQVEGGREFLVRVPGVAQSALSDQQLAELLNWILREEGMAGESMPENTKPYTAAEVAKVRDQSLKNLPETRAKLILRMREKGIPIHDGMPIGDRE